MKIDSDFIYKIFNLKLKLKKESDKIKLSSYEESIPMYDIFSQKIYPINKNNIHYRLIESHYRFINEEIYRWLSKLYDKYKKDPILGPKYKYNMDVLDNYVIDRLLETSYKTLYKYSPQLGLQVSICKRNSFHPFIFHLKPYYTKLELIKLGQNMHLPEFKDKMIDLETLIDMDTHYNVCKIVSSNDVSFEEIRKHHNHIISNMMISWVTFYSFTGSFLFNNYLRNRVMNAIRSNPYNMKHNINPIFNNGLIQLVQCIENAPALDNDYDIYRFIWDDSFLINLKEGDIFMDKGFVSTTRDPFYSPGLNGNFGLVLLKIKLPKNKKGIGLFVENFSLFSKEEEFLLPPNTKLKLISKNENFKYYHTNKQFEALINRKYEFELIESDYESFYKMNLLIPIIPPKTHHDIKSINIQGIDRIDIIRKFLKDYKSDTTDTVCLKLGNSKSSTIYSFTFQWFDSTNTSSYENLYYNKIKDGIIFTLFDTNGYPYLNIELGSMLVVNYINSIYYYNHNVEIPEIDDTILDLIYHFGRIFYYKEGCIFHKFKTFNQFANKKGGKGDNDMFLNFSLFNYSIYDYLKTGTKFLSSNQFIDYKVGYWLLDEYFGKDAEWAKSYIPEDNSDIKTNKDLLIYVIENYFYLYPKIISLMDKNIFSNHMVHYNIYDRMVVDGIADTFKPNISYESEMIPDENYKLIFRQPIRRV
jgi:hypothetical protein